MRPATGDTSEGRRSWEEKRTDILSVDRRRPAVSAQGTCEVLPSAALGTSEGRKLLVSCHGRM